MQKKILSILIILIGFTLYAQQMTVEYGATYFDNGVVGDAHSAWKAAIVYDFGVSNYYVASIETAWQGAENNMGWMVTQFDGATPSLTPIGDLHGTFNCAGGSNWITININSGTSVSGKVAFIIETGGNNIYWDTDASNSNGDWNYWPGDRWYHYDEWTSDGVNAIKANVTTENPLPVELLSFNAQVIGADVLLDWETATEVNNYGFEVERCQNNDYQKIGFVQGHGNSNSPKEYLFRDKPIGGNEFRYRLKQIDFDGQFEYLPEVEVILDVPEDFSVRQNFPNPFNPTTKINFSIPMDNNVVVKVFDVLGMEVATLLNENRKAGTHSIEFYAGNLSSGIYFYKIVSGNFSESKKMILLR